MEDFTVHQHCVCPSRSAARDQAGQHPVHGNPVPGVGHYSGFCRHSDLLEVPQTDDVSSQSERHATRPRNREDSGSLNGMMTSLVFDVYRNYSNIRVPD